MRQRWFDIGASQLNNTFAEFVRSVVLRLQLLRQKLCTVEDIELSEFRAAHTRKFLLPYCLEQTVPRRQSGGDADSRTQQQGGFTSLQPICQLLDLWRDTSARKMSPPN